MVGDRPQFQHKNRDKSDKLSIRLASLYDSIQSWRHISPSYTHHNEDLIRQGWRGRLHVLTCWAVTHYFSHKKCQILVQP